MRGKIVKGIAGFYYVACGEDIYECKAKGIFRIQSLKPLIGDDVELCITDADKKVGTITKLLPRNNELIRPAVANIDQAMVVFAPVSPELHYGLLDRFLVMMEVRDVPTLICINKMDQGITDEMKKQLSFYESAGYPVYYVSATERSGLSAVRAALDGKTTVLAGASGVGKSSLLNAICETDYMEVGSVSDKLGRGRHTTRHSELFCLGSDTFICDTPGFSSLDLPNLAEAGELRFYFPELAQCEGKCRYGGCTHLQEPDCYVKKMVAQGTIGEVRYHNYELFCKELGSRRRRYD